MNLRFDYTGKVALVTGSSRGIGAAILTHFARAGATCVLHYVNDATGGNQTDAETLAATLQSEHGVTVHRVEGDISQAASVERMMAIVREQVGGLDILVNNAGVIRDRTLKKMTLEEWRTVISTNLDGVFHGCKYGTELLRDGGRIVNIASVAGLVGFHGQANYAAAKAGVIGLTRVLAKELARRGITVNAVAPGVIQTTMLGTLKPEVLAGYEQQIPVGRLGRPEDVANTVLFLASAEAGYITGQVVPVTGGWHT